MEKVITKVWKPLATFAVIVTIAFLLFGGNTNIANAANAITEDTSGRYDSQAIEYNECGACGAHIMEWWFVTSNDGERFVPVCKYCYEAAIDYHVHINDYQCN